MAFLQKTAGVAVIARDGEGFEFILMLDFRPLPEHFALGQQFFSKLRTHCLIRSTGPKLIDPSEEIRPEAAAGHNLILQSDLRCSSTSTPPI
jgi:hypothetical protein